MITSAKEGASIEGLVHGETNSNASSASLTSKQYRHEFLDRTRRLLDEHALERLRNARVLIAGCGGTGGAVAVTMARMGVGGFTLADPGLFDEPDVNRQWAADTSTLGRNKAQVYEQRLRLIDPTIQLRTHPEGVCWENVESLVDGVDVVMDCLDLSVESDLRAKLFEVARARGCYAISAPVVGFGTFIAASAPGGAPMDLVMEIIRYSEKHGRLPEYMRRFFSPMAMAALEKDMQFGRVPSLSVGPALAAALIGTEMLAMLLKGILNRDPVCLPNFIMMDALEMKYHVGTSADWKSENGTPLRA